jgi:hypothetical protein
VLAVREQAMPRQAKAGILSAVFVAATTLAMFSGLQALAQARPTRMRISFDGPATVTMPV